MIEEEAYVAEVSGGRVWLEKHRKSGCSGCAQPCPSSTFSGLLNDRRLRFEVASDLPLRPGDKVLVGIAEDALASASLWIYLLPLLCLFGGAALGKFFAGSDLVSALGGLGGLALCYAALKAVRLFDRQGYQPVILRKIN